MAVVSGTAAAGQVLPRLAEQLATLGRQRGEVAAQLEARRAGGDAPIMAVVAGTGSAGTLGDLLGSRRRRRFVGRASEVELFRLTLESSDPLFSVLYIQGPGRIGKTTLLDVFGESAARAGAGVVRLDGRDIFPVTVRGARGAGRGS